MEQDIYKYNSFLYCKNSMHVYAPGVATEFVMLYMEILEVNVIFIYLLQYLNCNIMIGSIVFNVLH
jgi:hypothetical protein